MQHSCYFSKGLITAVESYSRGIGAISAESILQAAKSHKAEE